MLAEKFSGDKVEERGVETVEHRGPCNDLCDEIIVLESHILRSFRLDTVGIEDSDKSPVSAFLVCLSFLLLISPLLRNVERRETLNPFLAAAGLEQN